MLARRLVESWLSDIEETEIPEVPEIPREQGLLTPVLTPESNSSTGRNRAYIDMANMPPPESPASTPKKKRKTNDDQTENSSAVSVLSSSKRTRKASQSSRRTRSDIFKSAPIGYDIDTVAILSDLSGLPTRFRELVNKMREIRRGTGILPKASKQQAPEWANGDFFFSEERHKFGPIPSEREVRETLTNMRACVRRKANEVVWNEMVHRAILDMAMRSPDEVPSSRIVNYVNW